MRVVGVALLLLVLAATPSRAQDAAAVDREQESWSAELAGDVMSPFCPGRTLIDCPSAQAREVVDWIDAQEAAGRSRDAVEEELYEAFGDVLLQAPRAEGFGLTAYVVPVVASLAGAIALVVFLRRQGGGPPPPSAPPTASPAPEDAALEREIDDELGLGRGA